MATIIDFDKLLVSPFVTKIDSSLVTVSKGVIILASILAMIDFTLTMLRKIENRDELITAMIERMLKYSFWFGVILNYVKIKEILLDTFISLVNIFTEEKIDITKVIGDIYNSNMALINKLLEASNKMTGIGNLGWRLLYVLCWVLAFALLMYVLVSILFAIISFHLVTGLALIFVPFATFDGTNSIGQKFITAVMRVGLNLSMSLIIQAMSFKVLNDYTFPDAAVSESVNKPQLLFGWIAIFSVCGYIVSKASAMASIVASGNGDGLTATGLGKAMIAQIQTAVVVGGAVVTAGAAAGGAAIGAAGGTVSGAVGGAMSTSGTTVTTAVNGAKTGTMIVNNATKMEKVQAVVKGGFRGAKDGVKTGFDKGKKAGNITRKTMKNTASVASKGIKIVTTDDPINNVKSILTGQGKSEKLTEEEKAMVKGGVENIVGVGVDVINYGLENTRNVIQEVNKNGVVTTQEAYNAIFKGSYKTFKESKVGQNILEKISEFKNGYKGMLPRMNTTKSGYVANKIGKLAKTSNSKTEKMKTDTKKILKKVFKSWKNKNKINNLNDPWNKTKNATKKNKIDPWE